MKKEKRWVLLFLAIVLAGVLIYMLICYRANPEGYFTNVKSLPYYYKDDYARAIKAEYMLSHRDEIDGIILGGSKCGAVDTDLMKECTGLSYYNMYLQLGNFKDYLSYTRFAAEKVKVKEILLVLSCYEVLSYDRTYRGNNYHTPALLEGSLADRIREFLSWMIVDPDTLKSSFKRQKQNPAYADAVADGRRTRMREILSYQEDPDAYAKKILSEYEEHLGLLFSGDIPDHTKVMKQNLEALEEMIDICQRNDVTLKVVIGPATMTERYRYEDESYYDYMVSLVRTCGEVWDFSDYNAINMNLYNYADHLHYDLEVADLMVNTIYGRDRVEGFGQVLTNENISKVIQERKDAFDRLKTEYEQTGTVALKGREDDSYLPWRTEWVSSAAGEEQMRQYWDSALAASEEMEEETDSVDY